MKNLMMTALLAAVLAAGCESAPKPADSTIVLGAKTPAGAEAEAAKELGAATADFQQRGFAGLSRHIGALKKALDGAPAKYPAVEQVSEGRWVVRASDFNDGMLLSIMASAAAKDKGGSKAVVEQTANVYPSIALMLGSDAVERKQYTEALGYLERGLALQPQHASLLIEKTAALVGLRRLPEAMAVADAALASDDLLLTTHAAPFHRRRGFVLVEMGRLDEAQKAYEESLKLEPDNATAKGELTYIRGLKAGAAPTQGYLSAPGAKGSQPQ
jgi:tetratricopeptide (TPR) repeat protein